MSLYRARFRVLYDTHHGLQYTWQHQRCSCPERCLSLVCHKQQGTKRSETSQRLQEKREQLSEIGSGGEEGRTPRKLGSSLHSIPAVSADTTCLFTSDIIWGTQTCLTDDCTTHFSLQSL